jgi:hypothetical protein
MINGPQQAFLLVIAWLPQCILDGGVPPALCDREVIYSRAYFIN